MKVLCEEGMMTSVVEAWQAKHTLHQVQQVCEQGGRRFCTLRTESEME